MSLRRLQSDDKSMEGNELHLSSVIQTSSPWKVKSSGSFLTKIAHMETETAAIILNEDSNKPLRYLYLSLLMNKRNNTYLHQLVAKVTQISSNRESLQFLNLPHPITSLLPASPEALLSHLKELQKKLENHSYSHPAVLKLAHEFAIVDPLLIAAFRLLADDYKLSSNALDWNATLTSAQVDLLMEKLTAEKTPVRSNRNRYVVFYPLNEAEYQFFRSRGVGVVREDECFDELSDNQTLRYQDYLMIEKTFSLL